jgi:hypothetical protein
VRSTTAAGTGAASEIAFATDDSLGSRLVLD